MKDKHFHLIGIGGIGMSGIARILLQKGFSLSGSDIKENTLTDSLRRCGVKIYLGHRFSNVQAADVVVFSSAIREDNPEIVWARRHNIPLLKRAQALALLMQDKTVITVTGAHGKTTTASMVSYLLNTAGLSPSIAIGGVHQNFGTNAHLAGGRFFVAEADESDGSFLYYKPTYSIITNIDYEHLDYYGDFPNLLKAFSKFVDNTLDSGLLFCCGDNEQLRKLLKGCRKRFLFFGLSADSHIYSARIKLNGLSCEFDCFYKKDFLARFRLPLAGMHNISNALSVIALGLEMGIDLGTIGYALQTYKGTRRRLQVKLDLNNILLLDDYAHHPTEIEATLSAISSLSHNRTIVVFQPHRFSRTRLLLKEFSRCLRGADYIIITHVYAAGEPVGEITAQHIYENLKASGHKQVYFLKKEMIVPHILSIVSKGDLIITLGAGDISKVCDELAEGIKRKNKIQ
jgi:UDP-N-acetylmuramate--alanine ligase